MSGFIQPKYFSEPPTLMNPAIFAEMQERGVLDLREGKFSLQDAKLDQERGIEFIHALAKKWNTQENEKKTLEALLRRILFLSDTARNRSVFSKITEALFKREGYFKRLFSGESWEEWTESRTALGKVVSQFRDCVQSRTQIENCMQELDGGVVHKANEEADALLKGLYRPDGSMSAYIQSRGSCVRGLISGTVGSLFTKNPFLFFLGLSGCFSQASAQQKIGPEFQVNTYTTDAQRHSSVATFNNGNFIVAWSSTLQDGSFTGVYGQLFDGTGNKIGNEFRVNTYTSNDQWHHSIATFNDNTFAVAWDSWWRDGDNHGISCQLFDESAKMIGTEFLVNNYTTDSQWGPSIASLSNDNFVVVWTSGFQDSSNSSGVYGQLFSGNDTKIGNEFQVNTYSVHNQEHPSISSFINGNFVVTWNSENQDSNNSLGVFGQLFNENGTKVGSEFQINTYIANDQRYSSVATLTNGNFIVAWESRGGQDGDGDGIFCQLFNDVGSTIGSEFQVNNYTTGNQEDPSVASFNNGNFVVTWSSEGQDGSGRGVYGQVFIENGTKIGAEFQVNNYTDSNQDASSVCSLSNGNFFVAWESLYQDGSEDGVYGQIFRDNVTLPSSTSIRTSQTTLSSDASASTQPSSTISSISSQTISSANSSDSSSSAQTTSRTSETSSSSTSAFSTSQTTSSIFTSGMTTSSKSTTNWTTSLNPSTSIPIETSPNGNTNISWLWYLLGAAGGAVCIGLTGFFLLKKRPWQHEKDFSEDLEDQKIPLDQMDADEGPSVHFPRVKINTGEPPIPSGGFETFETRPRNESRLPSVREEKGHTKIGEKYELFNKISREEALTLFEQTGIEIEFPEGKNKTKVELGAGNFGKLRIARNAKTGEFIGVKKVKGRDKIKQSKDEGSLQKKLKGKPNIMPSLGFVDSVSSEGEPALYQFMPLAGFGNGEELLLRLKGLDLNPELQDQILTHVAQGLLTGLSQMHQVTIYHFDMKPSNIVLDMKGETFVIDFGCAKELLDGIVREEVLGDTRYLSPERLAFSQQIYKDYHPESFSAAKADAWALGVTLLEMAIGTYPFDQTDFNTKLKSWDSDYFQRKLDKIPVLKNPAPDSLMEVVKGLLNVDPEKRLGIDDALSLLLKQKPFANREEQEETFAALKRGELNSPEILEPEPPRDHNIHYADVYCRREGIESLKGHGLR